MKWIALTLLLPLEVAAAPSTAKPSNWVLSDVAQANGSGPPVRIRAGYFTESSKVPFRRNIVYLQGLADSMMNHDSFFRALSDAGHRVVAFDYMGQGGSGGSMNDTRIEGIVELARAVCAKFCRPMNRLPVYMGWSTGGLAAYWAATQSSVTDTVVLITPGLSVKLVPGKWGVITEDTLTSAKFAPGKNPHVDPIKPKSPALVPLFATDLLAKSVKSRWWEVRPNVRGFVALAGDDKYADSTAVAERVRKNAPWFRVVNYPKARHEIHNEVPAIRDALVRDALAFLRAL